MLLFYYIYLTINLLLYKEVVQHNDAIFSDVFDNIYIINHSSLMKYDSDGNNLCQYSNRQLGTISYVDVSNPMRILVFYNNFNKIQFLDKNLSPLNNPIILDDIGYNSIGIACSSSKNGFWLFDTHTMQVILVSSSLNIVYKGTKLILPDTIEISPIFFTETNQFLIMGFRNYGIYFFDLTGKKINFFAINNLQFLQVKGNTIYCLQDNAIKIYNSQMQQIDSVLLNEKYHSFCLLNRRLAMAKNDRFSIFLMTE